MAIFTIRGTTLADAAWVRQWMVRQWGSEWMVVHGERFAPHALPGFIAESVLAAGTDWSIIGLVTYNIANSECEIITLDSLHDGQGTGTALIEAVRVVAQAAGCRRLHLVTTNDNLHALRFYQRRGFTIAQVRPGAVNRARLIKPEIPLTNHEGIPIRDEIELEIALEN